MDRVKDWPKPKSKDKKKVNVSFNIEYPSGFTYDEIVTFLKSEIGILPCEIPHDDLEFATVNSFRPTKFKVEEII